MSILVGVVSVNTGNNLLYLIDALLLGFMGISGFFGKRNLEGLEIDVIPPLEIFARSPCTFRVIVKNRKRFFPSFLVRVSMKNKNVILPIVPERASKSILIHLVFEKRGIQRIGDVVISSVFPFNFFVRKKKIEKDLKVLVFPELRKGEIKIYADSDLKQKENFGSTPWGIDEEALSIRDYVRGDPPKFIHWKASAKTGVLKVKSFISNRSSPQLIDFEKIQIEDIEEKIKAVAYEIVEARRRNEPIGLRIDGKIYNPTVSKAKIYDMLKELALYGNFNQA